MAVIIIPVIFHTKNNSVDAKQLSHAVFFFGLYRRMGKGEEMFHCAATLQVQNDSSQIGYF